MLINSLGLKNFKCFEELDVQFAPITLLTGANSSGKSSLIHAILAVLQTEDSPFYMSPNGRYVEMGGFEEIVHGGDVEKEISIQIKPWLKPVRHFQSIFDWKWELDKVNELPKLNSVSLQFEDKRFLDSEWKLKAEKLGNSYNLFLQHYSTDYGYNVRAVLKRIDMIADRLKSDSTNTYHEFDEKSMSLKELNELYNNPYFLFKEAYQNVFSDRDFNYIGSFRQPPKRTYYQKAKAQEKVDADGESYIDQIIEWEETDADKFAVLTEAIQQIGLFHSIRSSRLKGGRFELNVKTSANARFAALTDVGFGISQFLPIVVADLQLSNQSCLAVSQPEIHLHPSIQATFGNYLANQIRQTDKQYIVETHSEYLLNRIRLLLVTGELKLEDVRVLYFENDGVKSTVHDIEFTTRGAVRGAPQGFFDTYEMDVMDIAMQAIG